MKLDSIWFIYNVLTTYIQNEINKRSKLFENIKKQKGLCNVEV